MTIDSASHLRDLIACEVADFAEVRLVDEDIVTGDLVVLIADGRRFGVTLVELHHD